ncbi:MAG: ribonuclease HII [Candidatus Binatia bacterium]|nr:MAG: ribonuclease HII [Candidatus Binatia bacterium]
MGFLLRPERRLWERGILDVAGVDEAGVGPLAGPVVAAAVLLPRDFRDREIDDSKRLGPSRRERLAEKIRENARALGIGIATVEEIDRLNVYHAALLAMRRAVEALSVRPAYLLVDGRRIPGIEIPQERIVGGDRRSFSIAAASIVAKVTRDALMREADRLYPGYGFARHMGYGTREHREALERFGPCPWHRRSFLSVAQPLLPGFERRG